MEGADITSEEADMLTKVDRLLEWFYVNESQLKAWVERSEQNARQLACDPIGAVQSAGLTLDEDLVGEFEMVARAITPQASNKPRPH